MSSDSEGSEYGPLESTWGSQAPQQQEETKGWDSLLDPTIKAGPNNLGSGQLHRKGKNFKPIGEDLIVAQRLNKPVGKKKMLEAINKTERTLGLPPTKDPSKKKSSSIAIRKTPSLTTSSKFSHKSTSASTNGRYSSNKLEVPSTTRLPSTTNGSGSAWLQTSLVETYFWEKKPTQNNLPPPPPPPLEKVNTRNDIPAPKGFSSRITPKSKVENCWNNKKDTTKEDWSSSLNDIDISGGWGIEADTQKDTLRNTGWGVQSMTPKEDNNVKPSGWDAPSTKDSNQWRSTTTETKEVATNAGWSALTNGNSTANVGWGKAKTDTKPPPPPVEEKDTKRGGWGSIATETKTDTKPAAEEKGTNGGWGSTETAGWGTTSTTENSSSNDWESAADTAQWGSTETTTVTANNHSFNIPSSKPSWLNNDIPNVDSPKSPPTNGSSRFSNPSKQRYSKTSLYDAPKPVNYGPYQTAPTLQATAPPPPPENSILITINVELSDSVKLAVDVRELDNPMTLAQEFGRKHNITAENIILALAKLFSSQKEMALKKKQQKLQRRTFSNYQKHPSSVHSATTSSPQPFTRKTYY